MWHRLMMFVLLFVVGCGSIPTDSNSNVANGELVYVNDAWGFQISRPTSDWGISAQTFLQQRFDNGLPVVEVRVATPLNGSPGGSFRPELYLAPRSVSDGINIDALVVAFEENELKVIFEGYEALEDKQKIEIADGELVHWVFRNSPFFAPSVRFPGTRFLAVISVHKDQMYVMIGNGSQDEGFPVEDYRLIAQSLRFSSSN
ncbi:MAG: hypothetical protein HOE48_17795 [Candidatus Latescibacteria bacterium]|jgi:hypothetical protein|nr:hypothetical protein [Candidatus Latescibacterota bacterium]MBT4139777.1 hypothetical protein [Candidatus Latescibacterota bacterium]MBT5831585.1 hypothetical protein [Candidatus Latescibacterota bacterium]